MTSLMVCMTSQFRGKSLLQITLYVRTENKRVLAMDKTENKRVIANNITTASRIKVKMSR